MNTSWHRLFPDGLSDEAATALARFLYDLAMACESRYLVQIQRHHRGRPAQPLRPATAVAVATGQGEITPPLSRTAHGARSAKNRVGRALCFILE